REGAADRLSRDDQAFGGAVAGQSQLSFSAIAALNASRSPGLREVMLLPASTTSASVQVAPALSRSSFLGLKDVRCRPLDMPASARIYGAWQIAATGLSAEKHALASSTAFSSRRRASALRVPPARTRTSKSSTEASATGTSTVKVSACSQSPSIAWSVPSDGETMTVVAPASSRAARGLVNSTCSTPLVRRNAIFLSEMAIVVLISDWRFLSTSADLVPVPVHYSKTQMPYVFHQVPFAHFPSKLLYAPTIIPNL